MEGDHGRLDLRYQPVLVVALVAEDGEALLHLPACGRTNPQAQNVEFRHGNSRGGRPGNVVSRRQQERLATRQQGVVACVEVGLLVRPAAIDVVEVEGGRTEIFEGFDVDALGVQGRGIEGDVVVDELAEIGVAGWNGGVLVDRFVFIDRLADVILDHRAGDLGQALVVEEGALRVEHAAEAAKGDAWQGPRFQPSIAAAVPTGLPQGHDHPPRCCCIARNRRRNKSSR